MTSRSALTLLLLALLPSPRLDGAERSISSTEPRTAQYVLVVDDSRSMRETDPDRLAVFAARSLISMLNDSDEVSIVRLNGPSDGQQPPPIEPLAKNRRQMDHLLSLDGAIAAYAADNTPCRTALETVRRLLEEAWRAGVAQTVLFLTDGECTPKTREENRVTGIFDGSSSAGQELFQLYVLRFRGKSVSSELVRLAESSGGDALEVTGDDPAGILHPFALALSRSQGYESYLLDPGKVRLPAHRGAERVRLLAVAPGAGPELSFSVRDGQGRTPASVGSVTTGTHHYVGGGESGRTFRFAALDYVPGTEPVDVGVEGARDWKVVALPEYRLSARLALFQGGCETLGPPVRFGVDTGATVCAVLELVNAQGESVGGELSGSLTPSISIHRADQPASEPIEIAANPLGGSARFGVTRPNLTQGDYEFQGRAVLDLAGDSGALKLRTPPLSLAVSSATVEPQPGSLDLGPLVAGQSISRPLTFGGAFPPTPAKLTLADRETLPACLTAELSGTAEGEAQEILVDQQYQLRVMVHPYCGPDPIERQIATALRLSFDAEASQRPLPTVDIPLRFSLDYRLDLPETISVELDAGESRIVPVPVEGRFHETLASLPLDVEVAEPTSAASWPNDEDDLSIAPAKETLAIQAGRAVLRLEVAAHPCCPGGSYETLLGVTSAQPPPPGAPPLRPLLVPMRIVVRPAGLWACWGSRILAVLGLLALGLLIAYLVNIFRHTHLLEVEKVASRLKPLIWTGYGDTMELPQSKAQVLRLVRRGLRWPQRLAAWLRANPLRLGLPGRSYEETVELLLQPNTDVARSHVTVASERELLRKIQAEPKNYQGRLFATARAGVTFLAVPDASGRIQQMSRPDHHWTPVEEEQLSVERLRADKLVQALDELQHPEDGMAAGWQVG